MTIQQTAGLVFANLLAVLSAADGRAGNAVAPCAARGAAFPEPVFELFLRTSPTNQPVVVTGAEAVRQARSAGRTRYFFGATAPVSSVSTCVRTDADGFNRYRIDVSVADGWHLERTAYPLIDVSFPLAGDGAADWCVVGSNEGGIWHPKNDPVGREAVYTYPGYLAAQFAAVYNESCGFYFAAEDADGYEKGMGVKRLDHAIRFVHERWGWDAGDVTGAYDVVLRTVARTDDPLSWEDFADVYRVWLMRQPWMAQTYLARNDVPDWLKRAPAMMRYTRQWLARPDSIAALMDRVHRLREALA